MFYCPTYTPEMKPLHHDEHYNQRVRVHSMCSMCTSTSTGYSNRFGTIIHLQECKRPSVTSSHFSCPFIFATFPYNDIFPRNNGGQIHQNLLSNVIYPTLH